jgi:hypothetical protein
MVMTWLVINSLAWYFDSTAAIPFTALFFIGFLWGVVYLPLTAIGGISGRLRTIDQMPTAGVKRFSKPVPPLTGVHHPIAQYLLVGALTFWCISVNMIMVVPCTMK